MKSSILTFFMPPLGKLKFIFLIIGITLTLISNVAYSQQRNLQPFDQMADKEFLFSLVWIQKTQDASYAIDRISKIWKKEHIPLLLESAVFTSSPKLRTDIYKLLRAKTGQNIKNDINLWYQWLWNEPEAISNNYADFKAELYKNIDPKFEKYFLNQQSTAKIRLDEMRWGGVGQDGIPPLTNPDMIEANEAFYINDDDIIFGLEINGDARAYPKRILAWHEMFTDTVGGVDIAGVYCTLCGTVIPYKSEYKGKKHDLGTSGFLYRSNKLMYDKATQSLWNTIMGEPVLGPLAGKGIRLEFVGIVTTTWKVWKERNPNTLVLSIKTGFERNYNEGAAYSEYFETDDLMFSTPFNDTRLKNKQEVLALRFAASPGEQLAIDSQYLNKNPLYSDQVGFQNLIVLTDTSGGNRVYDPEEIIFTAYDRNSTVTDQSGAKWKLSESGLTNNDGRTLKRLPAHRAFWFGWYAAFPDTRLIK